MTRPPLQPVAPRIEDPIELLQACHDKVRRFATLALKLRTHLAQSETVDEQARDAAESILRYFNMAAPLHHEDEEDDLFPALRQLGQGQLAASIDALNAEHTSLAHLWHSLGPWLQATAQGQPHPVPDTLDAFSRSYIAHAQREEDEVYPSAAQLTPEQLARISAAMVARRTAGR